MNSSKVEALQIDGVGGQEFSFNGVSFTLPSHGRWWLTRLDSGGMKILSDEEFQRDYGGRENIGLGCFGPINQS